MYQDLGAFDLVVQNGQPTYPHDPIVVGDYSKAHYADNGGQIASGTVTPYAWNSFDLNATGLTWIQTGAGNKTKLIFRTSHDIAGTGPTSDNQFERVILSKTAYKMYLEIGWSP
jgi:hypothetical protein